MHISTVITVLAVYFKSVQLEMTTRLTIYTKPSQEPVAWSALALATFIQSLLPTQTSFLVTVESETPKDGISCLLESEGASCTTCAATLKSLASAFATQGLAGSNKHESDKVVHWLSLAEHQLVGVSNFGQLSLVADDLDDYLTLRSLAVGYHPTAADFALWGAIKCKSNEPIQSSLCLNRS